MDKSEYARQEIAAGRRVIFSHGTWWVGVKPFFFMPLHVTEPLDRGAAPPMGMSFLGYQHVVNDGRDGNCRLHFVMLENGVYGLDRLSCNTRKHVRKGLKNFEIKPIEDMDGFIEASLEINRLSLPRQRWVSDHTCITDRRKWGRSIAATFGMEGREDWGAYMDGRLAGYLRAAHVEDTMYIVQMGSREEYLKFFPNDALYHFILESLKGRGGIKHVLAGYETTKDSLNNYKRRFGFEVTRLPCFRWISPLIRPVLRFTRYRHHLENHEAGERN